MPIAEYKFFIKELKMCCETNNLNKLNNLINNKYIKFQKQIQSNI